MSASGLYPQQSDGRWLWFSGLTSTNQPKLEDLLEAHRSGTSMGTAKVNWHTGGAWVHFSVPAFAQACIMALNGASSGSGGVLRVRYAQAREDTSRPPHVRYVKRAPDTPPVGAPAGSRGGPAGACARAGASGTSPSGQRPTKLNGRDDDGADGISSKRAKHDEDTQGAAPSPSAATPSQLPPRLANDGAPNGVQAAASASAGGGGSGPKLWEGGPATDADVLRLALRYSGVHD